MVRSAKLSASLSISLCVVLITSINIFSVSPALARLPIIPPECEAIQILVADPTLVTPAFCFDSDLSWTTGDDEGSNTTDPDAPLGINPHQHHSSSSEPANKAGRIVIDQKISVSFITDLMGRVSNSQNGRHFFGPSTSADKKGALTATDMSYGLSVSQASTGTTTLLALGGAFVGSFASTSLEYAQAAATSQGVGLTYSFSAPVPKAVAGRVIHVTEFISIIVNSRMTLGQPVLVEDEPAQGGKRKNGANASQSQDDRILRQKDKIVMKTSSRDSYPTPIAMMGTASLSGSRGFIAQNGLSSINYRHSRGAGIIGVVSDDPATAAREDVLLRQKFSLSSIMTMHLSNRSIPVVMTNNGSTAIVSATMTQSGAKAARRDPIPMNILPASSRSAAKGSAHGDSSTMSSPSAQQSTASASAESDVNAHIDHETLSADATSAAQSQAIAEIMARRQTRAHTRGQSQAAGQVAMTVGADAVSGRTESRTLSEATGPKRR